MVYLDNNATTQLHDEVLEAMLPYLRDYYGNASSIQHKPGRDANHAVEYARKQICEAIGADSKELIFTSGATESINMALRGIASRYRSKGNHIITYQTEHKAVLSTCAELEKQGFRITYLSVDAAGRLDIDHLADSITEQTILVCAMLANNETGVIHPIADVARLCVEKDTLLFCDATQYLGKQGSIDLREIPIDMLCMSAHKLHGPKGIGALYIRRKRRPIQLEPLIVGGQQENSIRGGTYNVPNIVGFGKAVSLGLHKDSEAIKNLREYLESILMQELEEVHINGQQTDRLGNTSNLSIKHVRSSELMNRLPDIALSSGSACVTGSRDPSHVLKAMGRSDEDALCSIRISLSRYTTREEIDQAIMQICNAVKKIRSGSPIWQMYKAGLIE